MKVTIIYDNKKVLKNLREDWGFAAIIETNEHQILFDAGADGNILIENLNQLKMNLLKIDTVFISHHHFDHIGGLSAFLNANNKVTLFSPNSFRGVKNVHKNVSITNSQELYKNIFTTGELENIEQSLIIETDKGLVLIVGCAHAGLDNIIQVAEQYGNVHTIIGGFHDFRRLKSLEKVKLLYPAHCTRYTSRLKERYPEKVRNVGVGKVINL